MSLYGGDAEADYDAIVRLVGGRRVNLSEPARSLIVLKPTEFVERGGGTVLSQESEALKLLLDWVRQGAPLATTRHLTRVEILPKRHVARSLGDPAPAAGAGPAPGSAPPRRSLYWWRLDTPSEGAAHETSAGDGRVRGR